MSLRDAALVHAPTPAAAAAALVDDVLNWLIRRAEAPENIQIAVSGGSLGEVVLPQLFRAGIAAGFDWQRVHFWFADERFLPAQDPERNATLLAAALAEVAGVHHEQVHEVPAKGSVVNVTAAAARYSDEIARTLPADASGTPQFDVMLLGMGPDGHTASLFPGLPGAEVTDRVAIAVHDSPKPPAERVSLTLPVINASRMVAVYATGAGKRDALEDARGENRENYPIARIAAKESLRLYADDAALS